MQQISLFAETAPPLAATIFRVDPRAIPVPAKWRGLLARWLGSLTAAGQTPQTIASRRQQVSMAARHLPDDPRDVGPDDLDAYVVSRSWSRETRRTNYAALRSFFRWAVEVGVLEESPAEHLPRVRATDPCPRPTPEVIWQEAKRRACPRTLLILRLAAEAGLRRIEVARVHSDDLVEDLEGWSLLVHGKGGKLRTVPLVSDDLALAIRDAHGYLFPGDDEGHLSPRWVGKLATRALPGVWTLHTLRHRCATKAYGLDSDLLAVQRFLGHSSPATTQRYIPTEASRMRRAASAAA